MKNLTHYLPVSYLELPQIKRENVRLLWHEAYWDGPYNGILAYLDDQNIKFCWFEIIEETSINMTTNIFCDINVVDDFNEYRIRDYLIISLSPDQYLSKLKDHNKFREMVGDHTDYLDDGKTAIRLSGFLRSRHSVDEFFKNPSFKKISNLEFLKDKNEILGWIRL